MIFIIAGACPAQWKAFDGIIYVNELPLSIPQLWKHRGLRTPS
jgi:hypothetical protein